LRQVPTCHELAARADEVIIEQLKAVHGKTHPAETGKKA